jgi:hypothetical protein
MTDQDHAAVLERLRILEARLADHERELEHGRIVSVISTVADLSAQARTFLFKCLDTQYRVDGSDSESLH